VGVFEVMAETTLQLNIYYPATRHEGLNFPQKYGAWTHKTLLRDLNPDTPLVKSHPIWVGRRDLLSVLYITLRVNMAIGPRFADV
jgi:hypothetical protein